MLHDAAGWAATDDWTYAVPWWNGAAAAHSWWIFGAGPSSNYVSADYFKNWIQTSGYATIAEVTAQGQAGQPLPSSAQVGDIIQYDYENLDTGALQPDGKVDHTMVIVGFDGTQALVVGVDAVPVDKNGVPHPSLWQNASSTDTSMFVRYPGARAYFLHIIR